MAYSGADPVQLRASARQLEAAADRLYGCIRMVSAITSNRAIWSGTDSDRFRSESTARSVQALNKTIAALREGTSLLLRNADEQERTSSADGGGAPRAGDAAPTVASTWGTAARSTREMWAAFPPDDKDSSRYRIQTLRCEDGSTRYIVFIGGTTGDIGQRGGQSWEANIAAAQSRLDADQVDRIVTMIGPEAEVMLVGHSQGGMDAQNIAHSNKLNVKQIVTFGSPSRADLDVPAVHLRESWDVVPHSTSVAFGAFAPLLMSNPLLGAAVLLNMPYAASSLPLGTNNEFFSADSGLEDHHNQGYETVSAQFDKALRSGDAGSQFSNANAFRGEVVDQLDLDHRGKPLDR